jgi:EmrB/QacA subfamily drug resistance transporter
MTHINTMKRIIPPIVALAIFMEAVDTTIINTAIPSMAHSLSVSVIDLKIALISYLLSLAIFIPISGWLADKFGTQKIFMSAILVFTLSSLACGFSTELYQLVLARFLQGMGGAFMIPVGRLIIVRLFHRTELISAMNRVILPALIGPALGPLLGGIISETFTWRWIFWVNIPFGILNFILAYYWIENVKTQKPLPLDKIGFLLFGLGLAGLVFGFSALSESGISRQFTFLVFLLSFILLISYALYATRSKHPVLKIQLFLIRTFRVSVMGNLITRLGFGGIPFLLPLFLQIPLNFSPQSAGMMVALTALGAMFIKFFSQFLVSTFGFKKLLLFNTIALGISLWLFIFVHQESSILIIAIFSLIYGVCASLQYSAMNPIAYSDISDEDIGPATSILSVNQQVSMSFGVAACALILKHFKIFSTNEPLLTLSDFHHTFFVLGFITIIAASVFLFLKKDDGENLIKAI